MRPPIRLPIAAAILLMVFPPAAAPPPGETSGLAWCPGTKDCLSWLATAGATQYVVYQGSFGSLPDLLTPMADACTYPTFSGTSTGNILGDSPGACGVFWYLVTGVNIDGEGPAGNATAGPRMLGAFAACPLTCTDEGGTCSASGECCSGRCASGVCRTGCCEAAGQPCLFGLQCCSGLCSAGVCAAGSLCGYGTQNCSGACRDVFSDPSHCGGCGLICSSNNATPTCSGGNCTSPCNPGYADCNGNLRIDGCETNISNNRLS